MKAALYRRLAGEPLLGDANVGREKELELLHESWLRGDWDLLARARGVFCAAHYNPATGELILVADKLCVAPLYYWATKGTSSRDLAARAESVELCRRSWTCAPWPRSRA